MSCVRTFFAARRNGLNDFAAVQVAMAAWRTNTFSTVSNFEPVDEPPASLKAAFAAAGINKVEALVLQSLTEMCSSADELLDRLTLAGHKSLRAKVLVMREANS